MLNIKLPTPTEVLFTTHLPIRIQDINYGNHLGHDALISLLHEARVQFLKSKGCTEFNAKGAGILVTSLAVNYIAEAFYGETLRVDMGIQEITRTGFELLYAVSETNDQKEIARAFTQITFFDYEKRKVIRIPEGFF